MPNKKCTAIYKKIETKTNSAVTILFDNILEKERHAQP